MSAPPTTATTTDQFFATENPDDPDAVAGMAMRKYMHDAFAVYAEDDDEFTGSLDHDLEMTAKASSTGMSLTEVKGAVYAYRTLRRLPLLRELQNQTQRLDLRRLKAVDRAISILGNQPYAGALDVLDRLLFNLFTPTKPNQELPGPNTITLRLNKAIGDIDSSVAFDPNKREKREKAKKLQPGQCEVSFHGTGPHGTSGMTMMADHATMASTEAFIATTAKEHGITDAEAVLKLLTGELAPAATATIYGYAPLLADGSVDQTASVFIPGHGFTAAAGTEAFHHMAAGGKVVDLGPAATRSVAGYVAPEDIKAFVRGRDGTCIYPGCDRPAWESQLDHRIPFDEGGATSAENLHSLCQQHHNSKTDKRAFYIVDPVSGDIVWLFADGTYALTNPDGFIGQQVSEPAPRWKHTLDDVERLQRNRSQFFAKCHRVLDVFEENMDYEACLAELVALEIEYGMDFPFHPVPFPEPPEEEE